MDRLTVLGPQVQREPSAGSFLLRVSGRRWGGLFQASSGGTAVFLLCPHLAVSLDGYPRLPLLSLRGHPSYGVRTHASDLSLLDDLCKDHCLQIWSHFGVLWVGLQHEFGAMHSSQSTFLLPYFLDLAFLCIYLCFLSPPLERQLHKGVVAVPSAGSLCHLAAAAEWLTRM